MMPRLIPQAKKQECVRLRLETGASTPAIARRLGICNQSAYKMLENYPWRPTAKKQSPRGPNWTIEENKTLERFYPKEDWGEIARALPRRSLAAISKQASALGLRRRRLRKNPRAVHPIVEALRRLREEKGVTRAQISSQTGYHVNVLLNWELGKARPRLVHVIDIAEALGQEIVLVPKGGLMLDGDIAYPSRQKLMAGRA